MNDYSSSPSFEVVEEIKVNHGLFVSTCQVAETFFHQLVPSQTVKVHLNPVFGNNLLVEKKADQTLTSTQSSEGSNFFIEVSNKRVKHWWKTVSTTICSLALLLMHYVCFGHEHLENENLKDGFRTTSIAVMNDKKMTGGMKRCNREAEKVSVVNIRGGGNSYRLVVFSKKIGIFLTVSLALCTMWANHNIISS